MERKLREYFASGAEIVWHMFPETQTVRVYASPTQFQAYTVEDEIDLPDLLPGFRVSVAELFIIE